MNFKVTKTDQGIQMVPSLPLVYEQKVVVFVDILGFEKLVERSEREQSALTLVRTVQQTLELASIMDRTIDTGVPFEFTQVSDSLVFSFPPEKRHIVMALQRLQLLQLDLLHHQVLCRGGITLGSVVHRGNAIFGPAYLEAYRLEKAACMPRIVVDAKVMALLEADDNASLPDELRRELRSAGLVQKPVADRLIRRDEDNKVFVDYIWSSNSGEGLSLSGMSMTREAIERVVSAAACEGVGVQKKCRWLADYFDVVLRGNPSIVLPSLQLQS